MKIKVLHITQSLGGVETYLRGVIDKIDKSVFELVVIAPFSESFTAFCEQHHIRVQNVIRGRESSLWNDFKLIFTFIKLINNEKPDLVHLHTSKAGFLGRIACAITGYRSLFTPHALSYLSFTGLKRLVYFSLEVGAKRITDKILAVSYSEENRLKYEIGFSAEKIYTILNSIHIQNPLDSPVVVDKNRSQFKIGTIARLTYQKNPLLFVEIAKKVVQKFPTAEFYILGAGVEDHLKNETISLINQYELASNVHILDWATQEESIEFLKSLDVFLLTSIFEGLPLSLLEAMSLGIPCVASNCDGCIDVIRNNINGYSCTTIDEYAKAVIQLVEDKELAAFVGNNGKNHILEYHNLHSNVKQLERIYSDIHSS